ncbi:MAG: hypothetical protein ACRDQ2_02970 [Gaiellales bacterium]
MRRRALAGAAATVALLLLAVTLTTRAGPATTRAATASQPTGAAPGAATVGGDRTEDGARAAAVSMATASQDWLYLGDADIDAAVRAKATAQAGPALAAETVAKLGQARQALGASSGRVWWLVRPLATQVEHYDPARARVVVWTVAVLSATGVALPQADWMRVAVDLAWADDGWRCEAVTETPGPTPATGAKDRPWLASAFDDALDGFERVGSPAATP